MKSKSLGQNFSFVSFLREWGMILLIIAITAIATVVRPAFLS